MLGFREEVLRYGDTDVVRNLLKIITGKYERDGRCEEEATRLLGDLLVTTAQSEGSDVVPCLTLQAILAWIQTIPQSKGLFIRLGVIPAVCTALQVSLPRACCDEVAMHTVSAAAKVILFYLRDSNVDVIVEDIEKCDGVGILLEACRAQGSCPRSICIGLHVLKHMTKRSPRLLRRAMEAHGPEIICNVLRENKDADMIKFGALTLSRWAASPGTQDQLFASGAYEQLWEILRTKEKYESSVYAYVMLAICLMMGSRIEEASDSFLERPQDFVRFCRAVDQYDASFQEQGVVHHTLGLLVCSSKSFDLIMESTKNDVISVLAKSNVRCGYILDILYQNRDRIRDIHDIQVRLKLAVFLVEKMALYPDASLGVLFYGSDDALIETLVAHSFEHLMVANMHVTDDESSQSDSDDEKMHLTKFSWESQSILFDSPGGFHMDGVSAKDDCSSHPQESEQHTAEEEQQLGHACFKAFASGNSVLGSLILLCKISSKMRQRNASNENLVSVKKRKCFGTRYETPQQKKKAKASHPTAQSPTGRVRRFIVGGVQFEIEEASICATSHVVASMCEDADCNEEIHVPCLHHLSTSDMVHSFTRILEWCHTGDLSNLSTMEEIQACWIVADYLGMPSLERHIGQQINNLVESPTCDRTHVFAKLHELHVAFYGSNTLESIIAECIVTELSTCGPGDDTISNGVEFLKDFVLHPTIADRVAEYLEANGALQLGGMNVYPLNNKPLSRGIASERLCTRGVYLSPKRSLKTTAMSSRTEDGLAVDTTLNPRVAAVKPSKTMALTDLASSLREQGVDIIGLAAGEPDFDTPEPIIEAGIEALKTGVTRYTPNAGTVQLRRMICDKLLEENGLQYSPDEIVLSNGAKQSVWQGLLAVCSPGDEVIIPAPFWVSYPEMARMAGAEPVIVSTDADQGFLMTPDQLKACLTPKSRLLILCSPSNPSGAVYSESQLKAIAEIVREHPRLMVLSDEIYEYIIYHPARHVSFAGIPGMFERTLTVNGFSKAYAMTGWRLGYLAAPQHFAKACAIIQSQSTSGASSIAQHAAMAALRMGKHGGPIVEDMVAAFQMRRDYVVDRLKGMKYIKIVEPQGAFYVLPDISDMFAKGCYTDDFGPIADSDTFVKYLIEKANVATVPGQAFGAPSCIRISYAASMETLEKAFDRIEHAIDLLKEKK